MSYQFRVLLAALVLCLAAQPTQRARAAEHPVVKSLLLKDLADHPGREMLMITVAARGIVGWIDKRFPIVQFAP